MAMISKCPNIGLKWTLSISFLNFNLMCSVAILSAGLPLECEFLYTTVAQTAGQVACNAKAMGLNLKETDKMHALSAV